MRVIQLVQKNKQSLRSKDLKNLVKAFKSYRKRYLDKGRVPDMTKLFPDLLYSEMRLEGEKITRKQAKDLFK